MPATTYSYVRQNGNAGAVPEDRAIEDADREAPAPIDVAPDSPGVQALAAVVERLVRWAG